MYYDLELFGNRIRKIRNTLGYTQKRVSEDSQVTIETLRKIENGKVIPTQITLELLSIVLKKDLNLLLLECRISEYTMYYDIMNDIEYKLKNGNYADLESDVEDINNIFKNRNLNNYMSKLMKQLSFLIESIILKNNSKDYISSLNKLVEAIKLTTPLFELDNYNEFVYSNIECRILMNIALLTNIVESTDKCIEILLFCLESLDLQEIDTRLRIHYNLAYSYHRIDLHDKALFYSDIGIGICIQTNNLSFLGLLYSRKCIAEYFLKDENFKESLKTAMNIYSLTEQNNLSDMLINFCNKHNIKIY